MAASVGRSGKLFKLQKYIFALLFVSFLCGMILGITLVTDSEFPGGLFGSSRSERSKEQIRQSASNNGKQQESIYKQQKHGILLDKIKAKHDNIVNEKEQRNTHKVAPLPRVRNPIRNAKLNFTFGDKKKSRPKNRGNVDNKGEEAMDTIQGEKFPKPNYNVHVFYYPWYGNPETDGDYRHWNHPYLAHWDKNEAKKWPHGRHKPPDDIGAQYYPELGPYSSRKVQIMEEHMKQIRSAGVGT